VETHKGKEYELCSAAGLLKSLGHPLRLEIVCGLRDRPCTQTVIAEKLGVPQSTIAQHLKVLRANGVVTSDKKGVEVVLRVADSTIERILDILCTKKKNAENGGYSWEELGDYDKKRRVSGT